MVDAIDTANAYADALSEYLHSGSEAALYRASLLSHDAIVQGIGPEDIIALHVEAVRTVTAGQSFREQARAGGQALQFLLEVMIAYGIQYREHMELRLLEQSREAQRYADDQQRRAEEAERSERQQSDHLAVIAHELGTPLTAARGTVDFARRLLARGEVERVGPLLSSAREALDRLTALSSELVDASRGQHVAVHSPQDLTAIVAQACRMADVAARERGISVAFPTPEDGPFTVVGDLDALFKVVGNLLANAVRYTPSGGRVTVRQWAHDGEVWTEVRDTGIGIPPEALEHIFEKFYRAPDARRIQSRGLGLGLALVQRHVSEHGGRIDVESVVNEGSVFRVALPRLMSREMRDDGLDAGS